MWDKGLTVLGRALDERYNLCALFGRLDVKQEKQTMHPTAETASTLSKRLIMLRNPAIHYLFIPKCGCTFVKNTLWAINEGKTHQNPLRIHDDDNSFERGCHPSLQPTEIEFDEHSFVVLRNPVDRFLSLYFDKVVGAGREKYVPLARTLIEGYDLREVPVSIDDHRHNLLVLARWLQHNLKGGTDLPKEAHWTPQSYRSNIMKTFNLKVLLVEHLERGLHLLLADVFPGINVLTAGVERNKSTRPVKKAEVLTDEIRGLVNEIYSNDKRVFRKAKKRWDMLIDEGAGREAIPRFRELKHFEIS
jgi:hypothetical protein